ncbi:hypothetical protein D3C73_1572660 [compost metagenome]
MNLQQAGSAKPAPQERDNGEEHPDQARFFASDAVCKNAHRNPEYRAAEDGNGDHGCFLGI